MSASDLASIIIAVSALAVVGVLSWLVIGLRQTTQQLTATLHDLQSNAAATVQRLTDQAETVQDDLHRVDGLLESAERVSARADTLSKVTYGAVARPVIKTAAVVRGTSKAARRLRRGAESETG